MEIKSIRKRKTISVKDYDETGALLIDAIEPGQTLTFSEDTDLVMISSQEYIIVDVEMLRKLRTDKIITDKDMGYIIAMSVSLKTELNATYNHTIPHTLETLSNLLGLAYENTSRLITRLSKKNIMHKYITADHTLYCINPFLSRRRKTISKELIEIFGKFKK